MGLKEFWKFMVTDPAKQKNKVPTNPQQQQPPQVNQKVTSTKQAEQKPVNVPVQPELGIRESTGAKKLTNPVILFILINSILGSSLFYLPSLGVISSGAASILAWIALFILAGVMMMYVGELVTLHPTSGGTYEFCKRAYGRSISFFAGWLIWIAGNFGMALNLVAASEYFIPTTYANYFILRLVFAAVWIIVLNFMAFRGIDAGATMLVVFGMIATIVILAMTIPSFISIPALFKGQLVSPFKLEMMQPFFRHAGVSIFAYLSLSLLLISEAFLGFEAVTYMANEAENPKKLHKLIISAIVICGVIMTLYIFSSLGTVNYQSYISNARPFAVQAFNTLGKTGETFVVFGMYLVIVGAAAAWPIASSRLIRAMAKDKLFLQHFAVLHPKHKSPYRAVYFQTIIISIFAWFIFRGYIVKWGDPYRTIYLIYVLLSMIVLSLILLAVPILRKKEAHLERPFKAPGGTFVPIIMVLGIILLVINWINIEVGVAWSIIRLAGSFIILGIPFYFTVEMFYNQKAIVNVNEYLSYLVLLGEKLFFPFTIRNKLLKDMGDMKGKVILEYGCSTGTLTKKLAEKVTDKGKIYALNLCEKKVELTSKRTKHLPHVSVYHHPHLDDFKLKFAEKVDGIISVGMLSYMQNPSKIINSLAKTIKPNGEIVFVDFDKFFYFIPNVKWIENDQMLKNLFTKAGFNVEVIRKRGLLWQYIIISGKKR
jgi:amino acid transporter/ubiquinone/menaquinone biosynthesis C-methylase UbiE